MISVGPLVAYKPDLDFDAELEAALEEASDVEGDKPGTTSVRGGSRRVEAKL